MRASVFHTCFAPLKTDMQSGDACKEKGKVFTVDETTACIGCCVGQTNANKRKSGGFPFPITYGSFPSGHAEVTVCVISRN